MPDQITMTKLGQRWGITRQAAAKLARTNPTFPEMTKQGRTVTVSWRKAKRWRDKQEQAELAGAMEAWTRRRVKHLRGQLYRVAQQLDGRYGWMFIERCRTVDSCYDQACKWNMNLKEIEGRPDGKPTDYDHDPEYYDSEEYLDSLEDLIL